MSERTDSTDQASRAGTDGDKVASDSAAEPTQTPKDPLEFPGTPPDPDSVDDPGSPETDSSAESTSADLAAEYLDRLQRLQAEFDNYRKRISREKESWWRQAKIGVISELLPVLDDVTRARQHVETSRTLPDAEGLMLILKKFADSLTQLGLEEMKTEPGTEFDPEKHEALMASPSDEFEEGLVASALDAGFTFEGEIVRPGKVIVSSGPATD